MHELSLFYPGWVTCPIQFNINKRLSRNSANEEVFKAVCEPYQKAIDESEYKFNLKFDPHARDANPRQKKKRNRRITWLNPPFSLNVKTNVDAVFCQGMLP